MGILDYSILAIYTAVLLIISFLLARRAAKGSEAYFLGGRSIPWWALGASGMSSNLDTAGTMTIITLIYTYGIHGFFIEMRGGVVLPIAVFLAFMGKWHRRSEVITTAEWMYLRFGKGVQGKSARIMAAFTYLVITVAMVVFFLAAAGKFLAVFLPFDPASCAVGMALVALVYTMISGLYGVVWTDVFQSFLIGSAAVYVSIRAGLLVDDKLLAAWPGARFNTLFPKFHDPGLAPYDFFWLFLLFWIGKGVLEGLGGSGGSAYMAQRFYAAKDEGSCRKLGMLWTLLFAFRWPMVLGFSIIAIHLGIGVTDPERILPLVIQSGYFPSGLRGLVVASILAASMSTFDSTINAGASYVVRDIVHPFRPVLSERAMVITGYFASILIVGLGLLLSLTLAHSILGVWTTIVIQLFPAFLVPFALRWFWSRFNGAGFTIGIVAGFLASVTISFVPLSLNEVETLSLVGGTSLFFSVLGTFLTPPADAETTKSFYEKIRPMGFWPRSWKLADREEHRADWLRLLAALVWQVMTFMLPMLAVLHHWSSLLPTSVLWILLFLFLLRNDLHETGTSTKLSD